MNQAAQISVRQPNTPSGGGLAGEVRLESGFIDGHNEVLILIHGYNNDQDSAHYEYEIFLSHLGAKFASYTGQPAEFYWPGDTPNRIVSTLSYPNQIHPAIQSGGMLADYLQGRFGPQGGPVVINLVGHSLGCRVVLELLARWTGGVPPNIRLGVVALMAAAVLVRHADAGGQLRAASTLSSKSFVLYSQGDSVLRWTFPLGETVAGEGDFPSAVGLNGDPSNTWYARLAMAEDGTAYNHLSYWEGESAAAAIASALGSATPAPAVTNTPVIHLLPSKNSILSTSLASRNLQVHPSFG
jgi:pimeloyl-ACP methyl ester carboxylesterase